MTINELKKYIELGNLPVLVDCKKEYAGICRMIKLTKNNIVFLDYGDSAIDSRSEGGFRVRFKYDTFENMVHSIEDFTGKMIDKWEPNKYDENDFECEYPDFEALKSDVYNNKISFLKNYIEFSIGDIYWNGLYLREISPQSTMSEIELWVSKISEYNL